MPAVSIIVPAYNAERTIVETIESLQQQTFSDFELIIINDGSTDKTVEVVEAIPDPRIKLFSYENGGLPVARNRGIERATGEFITFIDADDLWTPDKIASQVEALRANPEAGVAYSWTAFINENSEYLYAWEPLHYQGNVYRDLLYHNFISSGSNIMARRHYIEAAGEFDPTLKSVEDWDYYIRLAALCPFVVVPQYQILYRRTSQSMTTKVDVMEKYNLIVINRAFDAAPEALKPLRNRTLANTYRFLAQICLANSTDRQGPKKAAEKLFQSIQFDPKTLLERKTQRIALKIALMGLLPFQTASHLSTLFARVFPANSVKRLAMIGQTPSDS
ncbi:glycosyltransferase family 2 protein [Oculatella sp. LEGE 06141]|uniref:glycosyltransferase family 2 protein n=1 Tax=Oculatella sp. LEGE 06141 TaxID=1828648 RepID=UPI0018801FE2|nr:glycosyltransferase family A protein [Oculatella sp. LEGE 06141]MBE9178912.1 glycosyltransferase family 2 protein [Oculatella sp. LEGE 06141]